MGWRVDMEDAHTIESSVDGLEGHSFVAVYDGHGGKGAALYAGRRMMDHISKTSDFREYKDAVQKDTKLLENALRHAFLDADQSIKEEQNKSEGDRSGCTAISAFITPTHLVMAHAGDSRAILARDDKVVMSTVDHKPHDPMEKERIMNAGGYVSMKRVDGDLAVSRALGDFQYKDENRKPEDCKVTAVPDTQSLPRSDDDEFLLVACDGIWDVMSNEECADAVRQIYMEGEEDVKMVCEEILDMCLEKRSRDNMSVVIVTFSGLKTGAGGGVAARRRKREEEVSAEGGIQAVQMSADNLSQQVPGKEGFDQVVPNAAAQIVGQAENDKSQNFVDGK